MNVKASIEGANSLTKNALDCTFAVIHRDNIQNDPVVGGSDGSRSSTFWVSAISESD